MKESIEKLKESVIKASSNVNFIHRDWFVSNHLNIVEKIVLEIYEKYPTADINLMIVLVWIHDYPKIVNKEKEHDLDFAKETINPLLVSTGFDEEFINKAIEYYKIFESKLSFDLNQAPIEVKIVSSADGASHFFGNFFSIYWKENPRMSIEEIIESNKTKILKDWNKKIVIPEVKEVLQKYYNFFIEQGEVSKDKFLSL